MSECKHDWYWTDDWKTTFEDGFEILKIKVFCKKCEKKETKTFSYSLDRNV